MTGPVREQVAHFGDLKARELWAVGPLIALVIAFGVYPQPLLNIINPAVHRTLAQVHATDPVPPHPARVVVYTGKSPGGPAAIYADSDTGSLRVKGTAP
jgi:hypothetical protein